MSGHLKQWLVFALLLGTALYAIAEDLTLTTYYPSPRGVYQGSCEPRATPSLQRTGGTSGPGRGALEAMRLGKPD